jgi:hypothetical protein
MKNLDPEVQKFLIEVKNTLMFAGLIFTITILSLYLIYLL